MFVCLGVIGESIDPVLASLVASPERSAVLVVHTARGRVRVPVAYA